MRVLAGEFTIFTFILVLAGNVDPESGSAILFKLENICVQIFEEVWLELVYHWLVTKKIKKALYLC